MKKRMMAMLLAALLLVPTGAWGDGPQVDYVNTFRSALYGRAGFQSYPYGYDGYADADGLGHDTRMMGYDDQYIRIISKSASIWEKPRTNSKKLGSAANGDELPCVLYAGEPVEEDGFFAVEYKNQVGYVNRAYAVCSPLEIVLMESNVPAYIAPDSSSKCVGSLAKHTRYTVIGMCDDYYIINLRGAAAAFISKDTKCYDSRFEAFYLTKPTETGTILRKTTLRTGPGEDYAKVADVKAGDTFEFYDMINAWHMLRYTPKGSSESVFVFVYCNDVDVPIANG